MVSSSTLRLFVCKTINGVSYLKADYYTLCYTDQWYTYSKFALIFIGLYPIGIPALFFGLLYKNRHSLSRPGVRAQLGFLYDAYDRSKWWFELEDCIYKLIMTSLLAFIPNNNGWQLIFGLFVAVTHLSVLFVLKPYKRNTDDTLQLLVQSELILILYSALVLTRQKIDAKEDGLLSFVLISINVLTASFAFYKGFAIIGAWLKKKWELRNPERKLRKAFIDQSQKILDFSKLDRSGKVFINGKVVDQAKLYGIDESILKPKSKKT